MSTLLRTLTSLASVLAGACATQSPGPSPYYHDASGGYGAPAYGAPAMTPPSAQGQGVVINGAVIPPQRIMELGGRPEQIPAGNYWYDARSGLWGIVGSGTRGVIMAGLPLGAMPEGVSGRGMTGVHINGREITMEEASYLARVLGSAVPPGRYFLDGQGNAGQEGGPVVVNLFQKARQSTYISSKGTFNNGGGYYDPASGESFFSFSDSSGKRYETTY